MANMLPSLLNLQVLYYGEKNKNKETDDKDKKKNKKNLENSKK